MKMKDKFFGFILILAAISMMFNGCANQNAVYANQPSVAVTEPAPAETKTVTESAPAETKTTVENKRCSGSALLVHSSIETNESADFGTIDDIKTINDIYPKTNHSYFNTNDSFNPYDMDWHVNSGTYTKYLKLDWSPVFDVDYYMSTFPMLAQQYHNDKDLLFWHFQTVGVFEGRQASADFNVGAYMQNCAPEVRDAFGDNYHSYVCYYLANYDAEKSVDTTRGTGLKKQYEMCLTDVQKYELDKINKYRAEVGADPVTMDPELNAFAFYRSYINAQEDYSAHEWMHYLRSKGDTIFSYGPRAMGASDYAENNIDLKAVDGIKQPALMYRNSQSHYDTMVDGTLKYVGVSNSGATNHADNSFTKNSYSAQFDVCVNTLSTPYNP